MLNLQIEKFRKDIYSVLNNSELLIGTAYYVMKDIFKDLEKNYIDSLMEEEKQKKQNNEVHMEIDASDMVKEFDEQNITTFDLIDETEEE